MNHEAAQEHRGSGTAPALRNMAGVSAGVMLFGLSNGGNFALVATEMSRVGASDMLVGLATSAYFTGTLTASLTCGALVRRLGHKRCFALAALIACVSTAALGLIEQILLWPALRIATGYAIGMFYVVVESWFNHAAQNRNRGRVLAGYETVRLASVATGSFILLTLQAAVGQPAFLVAGLLYVAAILPVAINRLSGPPPGARARLPYRRLARSAPLGLACCFVGGLTTAAIYGLMPLYGRQMGLGAVALPTLIFVSHFAAFFVQIPAGMLSDRIGRNPTIFLLCLVGCLAAATLGLWDGPSLVIVMVAGAVTGGICHTVFTLGIVSANDRLDPASYVAGAAVLLVAYDIGTVIGPAAAGALMEAVGKEGLYLFIAALMGALAALSGRYLMKQ